LVVQVVLDLLNEASELIDLSLEFMSFFDQVVNLVIPLGSTVTVLAHFHWRVNRNWRWKNDKRGVIDNNNVIVLNVSLSLQSAGYGYSIS